MNFSKLDISLGVTLAIAILIYYLNSRGLSHLNSVDTIWFAYLFISVAIFLGGFYSLRGYKNNNNKLYNFSMMFVSFGLGGLCILAMIARIVFEFIHH